MPHLGEAVAALPWTQFLPLAVLGTFCRYLPSCRFFGHRVPPETASYGALLFTGVFLLPPALAALAPVPGALLGRPPAEGRARHALRLMVTAAAGAYCFRLLTEGLLGDALPLPGGADPGHSQPAAAPLTITLLPALIAVLTCAAADRALGGSRSASAVLLGHLPYGLLGLLAATLWHAAPGPGLLGALAVLAPGYICCWILARSRHLDAAHRATVAALVQAVDLKDRYTRGHSERVGHAAALIAGELGLDAERTHALRTAGALHDIGKLAVPTRTLRKEGPLDDEEWQQIRRHPEYGHAIVRGIPVLGEAVDAALHHHESFDGSGYPAGLAGRRIPEAARIVAVADAFDAMTSTRSYRRARPVGEALAELRRCAGTQFDPRMVAALSSALERHGWPYTEAPRRGVPGARPAAEPVPLPDEQPGARA
ncbi:MULTISPECIES: HD-GYP domain-containing protein [Streptomyces]|uniref:HD domain-containing protein n=2 Tax=Streptomyces harbinensis TaxID=1176198 RepID=A0A1I6UBL7_9ACTN|nr:MULTISPECIES: HD-GYP domain-containing protein [Streptomyces]SFS98778.1 HD domain-containing protein [Streptomyces harbinensis]